MYGAKAVTDLGEFLENTKITPDQVCVCSPIVLDVVKTADAGDVFAEARKRSFVVLMGMIPYQLPR
jgi:hypothetical protein